MWEYFKTVSDIIEDIVIISFVVAGLGVVAAVVYKIIKAEKIKAGPVEIDDLPDKVKPDANKD